MPRGGRPGARAREARSERLAQGTRGVGRPRRDRADHRLHASATARRLAAALPRPDLLDVAVTSNLQYGTAPDAQDNPVALRLDLYARRRHTDQAPRARVGSRRRLQRRRQDQRRAGRRGQHLRQAGLRRGLDQLPAARLRTARPTRSRLLHDRGHRGPARRAGGDPLAARQRRHLRDRPDADRDRRRVRRRDHRDAGRACTPRTRAAAATRARPRRWAGSSSVSGGLPSGVFASPGDAPGLFFHGTADTVVPRPVVGGHDRGAMLERRGAGMAASSRTARATCPGRSTARSTSSRPTTSSTSRSTWPTRQASRSRRLARTARQLQRLATSPRVRRAAKAAPAAARGGEAGAGR